MSDVAGVRRWRARKVAAVLAGGLVLGVGAMATLASWNDSESATTTFNAGVFKLQGSVDGVHYSDHPTAPGATIAFTTPFSNLHPGSVVYAPFAVQLSPDTTTDASVVISATSTGTVGGLTYRLLRTDTFGCTAGTSGTDLVAASAMGASSGAIRFPLTSSGATNTAYLCFKVTAGDTLAQGQRGTGVWQFDAISKTG